MGKRAKIRAKPQTNRMPELLMSLFHHIQSWPALDVTKQVKPKNESLERKDQNTSQLNVNETDLGKFTMIRTEEENRLIIVAQMMSTKSFFSV